MNESSPAHTHEPTRAHNADPSSILDQTLGAAEMTDDAIETGTHPAEELPLAERAAIFQRELDQLKRALDDQDEPLDLTFEPETHAPRNAGG